jgi:exosortase/archaeosortase family protein
MAQDDSSACSAPRSRSAIALAWPIGLLLLEATALTPFVEFSKGSMALFASPHFLTAGIVALATFFLIVTATESRDLEPESDSVVSWPSLWSLNFCPWPSLRWKWLGGHLLILISFVWLTLTLHARSSAGGVSWPLSIVWLLTGTMVALSILLVFIPLAGVISIARHYIWQVAVAAAIGMGLIMMTPAVRGYWPDVDGPAIEGLKVLLNIYPGQALFSQSSNRWPIIGTPRMSLLVTPPCSELDSLLVFVLLGGTLWAAMGARLSAWKYLLFLVAGLTGLYALLSMRLYFMILIGLWAQDPYVAVKFAHSRISTLAFLLYTLGILYLASRVARPTIGSVIHSSMSEEEIEESAEYEKVEAVPNS